MPYEKKILGRCSCCGIAYATSEVLTAGARVLFCYLCVEAWWSRFLGPRS